MVKQSKLILEYSKITEYIYIGTNKCCQTHFVGPLIKACIKADISLEGEEIDKPFGIKYYLWLPTKDHTAPSLKQLLIGARFIKQLVDNKIKVYVHCKRGHARSPTLVAAYLILKGKSINNALELIKKKRPVIHPNKSQIRALERFKKKIG